MMTRAAKRQKQENATGDQVEFEDAQLLQAQMTQIRNEQQYEGGKRGRKRSSFGESKNKSRTTSYFEQMLREETETDAAYVELIHRLHDRITRGNEPKKPSTLVQIFQIFLLLKTLCLERAHLVKVIVLGVLGSDLPTKQVAEGLDVSERTIQRYLERFRWIEAQDFDVEITAEGERVRFYFISGNKIIESVVF